MKEMADKENARRIINFDKPDRIQSRVPIYLVGYRGCYHESYSEDIRDEDRTDDCSWVDVWGTTWEKRATEYMGLPIKYPLSELEDIAQYEFPDPYDPRIYTQIYCHKDLDSIKENAFLTGFQRELLWERAYMLGGMENIMMSFLLKPDLVKQLFQKIMDFQMVIAEHYVRLGVEMIKMSDDLGGQKTALFSNKIFKEFFLPQYERIFSYYKEKDILIYFHSCGNIESFLDDFINLGVDILNPVQATANNLQFVREKTNGKIAIEGALNSQVMMSGTADEVRKEVIEKIAILGKNGGYFCCPDQKMNYPEKNLDIMMKTIQAVGKYPIRIKE